MLYPVPAVGADFWIFLRDPIDSFGDSIIRFDDDDSCFRFIPDVLHYPENVTKPASVHTSSVL